MEYKIDLLEYGIWLGDSVDINEEEFLPEQSIYMVYFKGQYIGSFPAEPNSKTLEPTLYDKKWLARGYQETITGCA